MYLDYVIVLIDLKVEKYSLSTTVKSIILRDKIDKIIDYLDNKGFYISNRRNVDNKIDKVTTKLIVGIDDFIPLLKEIYIQLGIFDEHPDLDSMFTKLKFID